MNKNTPVLELEIDEITNSVAHVGEVYNSKFAPICIEIDDGIANRADLQNWMLSRCIPASRDGLKNGLENLGFDMYGLSSPSFLITKCFGLSLSDQYWINPKNSELKWSEINFFDNDFSEDIGIALFDNKLLNCPNLLSPDNTSDGWLKKKWKIIDGKRFLFKSGSGATQQEAFNECIANIVCRDLGIENFVKYSLLIENNKAVSMCENFITHETELVSAFDILKSQLPNRRVSSYDNFINCCNALKIKNVENSLDEMLLLDFIIGNFDRHYRNFGAIRNVDTLEFIGTAPIFDSGTSLYCNVPTTAIPNSLNKVEFKPFAKEDSEHLSLIKNPDRFNLKALNTLSEKARNVFETNNFIDTQRINFLCDALTYRVKMLDKLLCKNYTNGIVAPPNNEIATDLFSNKSRGR